MRMGDSTFRFRKTIAGFEGSDCLVEFVFSIVLFLDLEVGAIPAVKSTSNPLSSPVIEK